jgi:hypothetical protein
MDKGVLLMNKVYDYTLSTYINSNPVQWGKPFVKGTIKALFIPSVRFAREIVELILRADLEHDNVTIDRYWDVNRWGFGDFYNSNRCGLWDFKLMYQNLEAALTADEHYDVIVMPGINGWGYFTPRSREALLHRVENGTGLVLIQPFAGERFEEIEELSLLSPLKPLYNEGFNSGGRPQYALHTLRNDKWQPLEHYITKGIPFELFPYKEMGYYPYKEEGSVIIRSESGRPVAAVKEYGKGRIAAFGYYPRDILPQHVLFHGYDPCYEPIIENWHGAKHMLSFNYLEYFYKLIYRSMIWAAKREPEQGIHLVSMKDDALQIDLLHLADYTIEYVIKNEYDDVITEGIAETSRSNNVDIPLPDKLCYGGRFRAEILLKQEGKAVDWYTFVAEYTPAARVVSIHLDKQAVKPGECIGAGIEVSGSPEELLLQVLDDYDRILYQQRTPFTGDPFFDFTYVPDEMRSIHCRIRVEIYIDSCLVQRMDSKPFIVSPADRQLKDFEVFMCPINRGQGDLLNLERERMLEMGITGLFLGDNKLSTLSGAEDLFITWNERDSYVERKELYLKTKDKKYLYRQPSLNDPVLWQAIDNKIVSTVKQNARFSPISYFANDEGSLTCYTDELDLDFSPACMAEMRNWLKEEYDSLDALNAEWDTAFASWDDVVPSTYLEVIRTSSYASWGDHRRFMSLTFANTYKRIRDCIRKVDREGVVRISGTQKTTPYSGYDYYMLHQFIGYFEAYSIGNQYELHRSFAKPGTIIGTWVGYGSKGRNVWNQIWKAVLHGVTLLSVFWEYSCLNPDFTFSKSAEDMGKAFREIKREGIGKLLLHSAERDSLGIGIHYSMSSIHGSYLRQSFVRYENNLKGWIDVLEDLGYQYNFVASPQIEAGDLIKKGYKLFILPYSIALSPKEAAELKEFVRNGGIVIGDIQTGIMDHHCKLFDSGSLDELFGIERYTTDTQPFYLDNEFTIVEDFSYFQPVYLYGSSELALAEYGTRMKEGKAAYVQDFSKAVAAVVVNSYGRGKGIYLNFTLDQYPNIRKIPNHSSDIRELIKKILVFSGVRKYAAIIDKEGLPVESGYETIYFKNREAEYVAVLRDLHAGGRVGYDGIGIIDETQQSEVDSFKVVFDKSHHVYDIREKRYLGYTDRAALGLEPGEARIFSLLPQKVQGIHLEEIGTAYKGDVFTLRGSVVTDGDPTNFSHTLSIRFYDPTGRFAWIYAENRILDSGTLCFEKNIFLPYNEQSGTWRVSVRDVATGVTTEQEFKVTEKDQLTNQLT